MGTGPGSGDCHSQAFRCRFSKAQASTLQRSNVVAGAFNDRGNAEDVVVPEGSRWRWFLLFVCWDSHPGVMWLCVDESRCWPAASRRKLQVSLCDCATRGICAFMKKKQSTTCVNGEKRAAMPGAVARPVQDMRLFHTLSPCHYALRVFAFFARGQSPHSRKAIPNRLALVPIYIGGAPS